MSARRAAVRAAIVVSLAAAVVAGSLVAGCAGAREPASSPTSSPSAPPGGSLTVLAVPGSGVRAVMHDAASLGGAVTVTRVTAPDCDGALSALHGGKPVDLILMPGDQWPAQLTGSDLLQPLDPARLPGLASRTAPETSTPDGRVSAVPLGRQLVGIVFKPGAVRRPVSFRSLFSRGLTGRVAMIDSPVLGLEIGALASGYRRPAELDDAGLLRVKVLYEKHRASFRLFWRRLPALLHAFKTGRVSVAAATLSDADWLRAHGLEVRFVPGREGGLLWSVLAGIPARAAHPEAAYAFLRAALSAEGGGGRLAASVVRPPDYAAWFVAWDKVKRAPPGGG